ncbi:GGDEF domain-containing protein [Croceibacterium sp. LX-88]|uniref:diguanylate cyclase n=1 Tax=Croceibacterium selenioxidans TaxID=2838833 RepID=A0ABS5W1G2_9SPHN|nr:diguanylate cyclase [Croceibacterium selenioxidans]MBT2133598.1 GGDEF domain-containing protein [Croceibacterium selenioxidans]
MAVVGTPERWVCGTGKFSIDAERVLLRFEVAQDDLPKYFLSRRSALEAVHLLAIDHDGAVRQATVAAGDLSNSLIGGYFKAPLPKVTRETREVITAVDRPSHRMTLEKAHLASRDAGADNMRLLILLAGLSGTLVMPLIFNVAFYRILREPFVIWHSALALTLLLTIVVSSGLAVMLFDPPPMTLSWLTTLLFGMTVAAGAMFTYRFIEPGLMHSRLRRLLPCCAAWALFLSAFHAALPFVARPVQSSAYTAGFAPILIIFLIALIDALRRGSRAAKFQAVGYAPMVLVGLIRLVTGVAPGLPSTDAMVLFYVGCISEILSTTLGMADRFVTMKRERDRARTEAEFLELLSETDPLTGLPNRRAIEREFEALRSEGFGSLAVIDLDHFKSINDAHGHSVGDAVLKAVGDALQPKGPNLRAYRLGGEEFVLLLRGENAASLAEVRRRAIPATVAEKVAGLGRSVTASMGVTNFAEHESFAKSYERADKLLYEAKDMGRDCTRTPMSAMLSLDPFSKRAEAA